MSVRETSLRLSDVSCMSFLSGVMSDKNSHLESVSEVSCVSCVSGVMSDRDAHPERLSELSCERFSSGVIFVKVLL